MTTISYIFSYSACSDIGQALLFTSIALFAVALLGRYIRRKIRVARILRRIR